jgi:hypothetical protein
MPDLTTTSKAIWELIGAENRQRCELHYPAAADADTLWCQVGHGYPQRYLQVRQLPNQSFTVELHQIFPRQSPHDRVIASTNHPVFAYELGENIFALILRIRLTAMRPTPRGLEPDTARTNFDSSLARWLEQCQALVNADFARHYPNLTPPTLVAEPGRRYVRIVSDERTSRSAWAFVDTANGPTCGDILKPASWKTPAKHARGNIFDPNPMQYITSHGPAYLRR